MGSDHMHMGKLTSGILVICLVLTGFLFLSGCVQKGQEPVIVKTDTGQVSGINQDGIRVYHGIPFAAPPTGELRWKPPAPVQPWDGVKNATQYSATCPQPASPTPLDMSEDCLYLNVWTPAKSADEKLPVMVFFYGGGFVNVAGSMTLYNGTTLAQNGVIVVTPNYRLGALGFLAHPQLDNESVHNVSGNYGIMDQQAALSWVKRNIAAFGGDPSRVTIFGQSAGAESVLVHIASPTSKGLFSQAIVESGPFWARGAVINATHSKAEAEQFGVQYATSLGYTGPDAIAQMRSLSPEALIDATPSPSPGFWTTHTVQFEPTIDGWILPETLDNLYLNHKQNSVPLMIGNNADDGTTLSAKANMTVPEYISFLKSRFGNAAEAVFAKYPANSTEEVQLRVAQIMTDYDFSDSVKFAAGSMQDLNPDTYVYRYSYILPDQSNGAFHGSETLLLFKVPMKPDPVSNAVSENLVNLWTRFAKTGNPNGGMTVTWPNYTKEKAQYLDINETLTVKDNSGAVKHAASGDWKFVVFADSPDPAGNTTTGVSPDLIPIAKAVAAEKPDLALYMGDLVNGWELTNASPIAGNYAGQFENWMNYVSPIHNYTDNTGIPLYILRGNHEDGPNQTVVPLLDAYRTTVASGMPSNGPPGEEKLTYSFTHKGAKFVANDNYIAHNGLKETVNQSWVSGQLTQDTRPFMFVFGHSPAYAVVNDTEEDDYAIDIHSPQRDIFWQSMVDNNVSAYFCGHAHLYVRGESRGVLQVVSGNAGAHAIPFDPANVDPALVLEYPKTTITKNDQRVGYLVITVHEGTGTFDGIEKQLNPATREWETVDTFTMKAR